MNAITKRPMQPVVVAHDDVIRFKSNRIVRDLLAHASTTGLSLNELKFEEYDQDEIDQFYQLIGYSVSGYGDIDEVSKESVEEADKESSAVIDRIECIRQFARTVPALAGAARKDYDIVNALAMYLARAVAARFPERATIVGHDERADFRWSERPYPRSSTLSMREAIAATVTVIRRPADAAEIEVSRVMRVEDLSELPAVEKFTAVVVTVRVLDKGVWVLVRTE